MKLVSFSFFLLLSRHPVDSVRSALFSAAFRILLLTRSEFKVASRGAVRGERPGGAVECTLAAGLPAQGILATHIASINQIKGAPGALNLLMDGRIRGT